MWSVCIRKLCQPRTEADGKPVTESGLSLRASAQVAAVMRGQVVPLSVCVRGSIGVYLCAMEVRPGSRRLPGPLGMPPWK